MDSPSGGGVSRPFLFFADAPSRTPKAPLAVAVAIHIAVAAGIFALGAATLRTATEPPAPDVITVTLVTAQPAQPAAAAAIAPDDAAEPLEPPAPTEFEIDLASAMPAPLVLPDILRLEDPLASLGAPSDAVREALAASVRCQAAIDDPQDDCPTTSDEYVALAELHGMKPSLFLDGALAPREGPPALWTGPVATTLSMETYEGLSGPVPVIMLRSRMTLPPRGRGADYAAPV